MFRVLKPDCESIEAQLKQAAHLQPSCPQLLSVRDGLAGRSLPWGFAHDVSRSEIGRGEIAFLRARRAMEHWREFDLGWVRVANAEVPIATGELVVVEARTAGLWSLNLSRIVETVDAPDRFGFLYATTAIHLEEGEERFVIEFDSQSGRVDYILEAVSRPRNLLARLGWPFARTMQHKFARESHARMRRAIAEG